MLYRGDCVLKEREVWSVVIDTGCLYNCVQCPYGFISDSTHSLRITCTTNLWITVRLNCVVPVLCVCVCVCERELERVCSQTQLCQLRCFNGYNQKNYMFRHLLAIVRFSSRELMVLLYILCMLPITCTHNICSGTISCLEENLTMANKCRNMSFFWL